MLLGDVGLSSVDRSVE